MYDEWAQTHGLGAAKSNGDNDQDGSSNALEYVLGSSPVVASAERRPVPVLTADGTLIFTFQRANAADILDATLIVEAGPNLRPWARRRCHSAPGAGPRIPSRQLRSRAP